MLFFQFGTIVPYLGLTVASWPAYRFLRRQVKWSGSAISFLMNFPQVVVIHTVKSFSVVNKIEIDVFLEFSCFLYDPVDVGSLSPGFSAFCKSSLYIWNFSVYVLLKPGLENFEPYFASMWNECNCAVVWIAILWDCSETFSFQSQRKAMPKNAQTTAEWHSSHTLGK